MLLFYAGEGDEFHGIKVQIEQCDRDTAKKVDGRKAHESYILISVDNAVGFVQLRTIIEGTNAQTPVNTSDAFQDEWRDRDNNE
jgi:hypothetical protein